MSTQKPSRELSIEETLTWTFDLYLKNFVIFFAPMLIAAVISGIFSAIISDYVLSIPSPLPSAPPAEILNWFSTFITRLLLMAVTLGILSWIISTIANGIIVKGASDSIEKGTASLGRAFDFTFGKLPSLLVAAFVSVVIIGLGFIALIVPGIILYIMFSLIVPAIVIENAGAIESLSRSRRLVSNRWLKTFVFLLIVLLMIGFVSFVASLVGSPFGSAGWIVTSIITAFVEPILPVSLAVYYYSMLAKEEQLTMPPPPPPPF